MLASTCRDLIRVRESDLFKLGCESANGFIKELFVFLNGNRKRSGETEIQRECRSLRHRAEITREMGLPSKRWSREISSTPDS